MSVHLFATLIRVHVWLFLELGRWRLAPLVRVVWVEFKQFPEDVEDDSDFELIVKELVLREDNVVELILRKDVDLVVLNFLLFELGGWFVELLEELNELIFHPGGLPNPLNVRWFENEVSY